MVGEKSEKAVELFTNTQVNAAYKVLIKGIFDLAN